MKGAVAGLAALLAAAPAVQAGEAPLALLARQQPALYQLYQRYPAVIEALGRYAGQQGFRRPVAQLATVVHELIHVDSAAQRRYFIGGSYRAPYLTASAWPALRNAEIAPAMPAEQRGLVYSGYLRATPANGLGNVLDEVSAYGQVLGFVCTNEPESARMQAASLVGHLQVVETYLRVARLQHPQQYLALRRQPRSLAALREITGLAQQALRGCGMPDGEVPQAEVAYLLATA